ncbi:hypothetical protein [Dyadobacter frigoris]|uniref:DUF3324 domain-containing protein n=1 Tax=Dyadobacter frigoris TaxID=2576211 RepID=A0A4U6D4M9_9BACT|nr:hypothetical protein [Dyadobacter frigoris]TKT90948.1 hypothetical protein FDK13_18475 [Dyadobacter frigoris]GLU56134.1 hypothetical protein Dfri01_55950 [Dyadobacter frigoris]
MKLILRLFFLLVLPKSIYASVVIVNGLTHLHSIPDAATKVQGEILVRNDGNKDSRILVYRQDLVPACGEATNYPESNSHQRSLGNGLHTNVDEKMLAGREEYVVRYTIELEKERSAPGTYWEVVMVEVADPVRNELQGGVQVNSKVRYAIQIILDVGVPEGPKLSFENIVFDKVAPKNILLKVQLKNNSEFGIRTNVVLEVYDGQGNKLKTTDANSRMMYPGYCNVFEIPLDALMPGKYECVIIADTGKDLYGSNISLKVD